MFLYSLFIAVSHLCLPSTIYFLPVLPFVFATSPILFAYFFLSSFPISLVLVFSLSVSLFLYLLVSATMVMWIQFAPLKIPLSRRLQTAAVLQWTFSFLAMAHCCLAIFALLLISKYWYLALLYGIWLYIDWETPSRGGRRSDWVRRWTVWRYFAEYFPIKLVRTAPLDPRYNYILGFHPHGVLVVGAFCNFCTEGTGFSKLFPGLTPHLLMLPAWFKIPFFREYIMSGSLVSSEKGSATHLLSSKKAGQAIVIAVGGPPEALDAKPGELTLQLLNRTGFIKLALTHGAHLVPVFSFGENDLYNQVSNPQGSLLRTTQEKLQRIMGLALPLFHGRGVFQYTMGLLPHRRPVYTVVGSPIPVVKTLSPSPDEISSLHKLYIERLQELFETHKTSYGFPKDCRLMLC
ncbi:2-acylglycerol O-acyltransferase 2-like [Discoglossus pictus]